MNTMHVTTQLATRLEQLGFEQAGINIAGSNSTFTYVNSVPLLFIGTRFTRSNGNFQYESTLTLTSNLVYGDEKCNLEYNVKVNSPLNCRVDFEDFQHLMTSLHIKMALAEKHREKAARWQEACRIKERQVLESLQLLKSEEIIHHMNRAVEI